MQTKCRSLLLLFVLIFPTVHLSRKSGRLSPAAHKDTHCCVIIICPCAFHLVLGKSQPRKKNIRFGISAALCGALADIVKTGYNFDMPPRIGIL